MLKSLVKRERERSNRANLNRNLETLEVDVRKREGWWYHSFDESHERHKGVEW